MNKKIILKTAAVFSISAAMLSGMASCAMSGLNLDIPMDTYQLEHCDVENYISVSGSVEGSNIVKVTSEVTAKIKTLNVDIGSSVKEGDILCVFDSSAFQEEYDKLKQNADTAGERLQSVHEKNLRTLAEAREDKEEALKQAQRAIDEAVSARDKAYSKYNDMSGRVNDLYAQYSQYYDAAYAGGEFDEIAYSKAQELLAQYESVKSEYEALGDQLSSYDTAIQDARDAYSAAEKRADAAIQAAQDIINDEKYDKDTTVQDQLDKLKESIEKCTVKAPKSGIITALSVAEGSIPTSEAIMTIEDTSQLRINVSINEADILNVHEGQKAVITTTATGDTEFSGTVSRVVNIMSGQTSNPYTGEATGGGYSAEITIDKGDNDLLIGMSAKVKIILDQKDNVLAVPYDAIVEQDDGSFCVFVAEQNGEGYTAKEVKVEKGMETNYLTEISSSELNDGDLIITAAELLSDGQSVNISESYYDTISSDGE